MIRICVCDYAERAADKECACDKNVDFASILPPGDSTELIKHIMKNAKFNGASAEYIGNNKYVFFVQHSLKIGKELSRYDTWIVREIYIGKFLSKTCCKLYDNFYDVKDSAMNLAAIIKEYPDEIPHPYVPTTPKIFTDVKCMHDCTVNIIVYNFSRDAVDIIKTDS